MQLVDPEEIPAMERLTQEVLMLREKVATAESRGQEATGHRRQQVVCALVGSPAVGMFHGMQAQARFQFLQSVNSLLPVLYCNAIALGGKDGACVRTYRCKRGSDPLYGTETLIPAKVEVMSGAWRGGPDPLQSLDWALPLSCI